MSLENPDFKTASFLEVVQWAIQKVLEAQDPRAQVDLLFDLNDGSDTPKLVVSLSFSQLVAEEDENESTGE